VTDAPLLDVRGLCKSFGGLQAVRGLSFALTQGEIVSLIGPNGAGKTTVFALLSGFHVPDGGEIRLRGRSLVGLPPHAICALGLARTFQIVRPFPHLSLLANVEVGALAREPHRPAAREHARRVLEQVGLAAKMEQPAGSLTLAERKRLELARALATGPALLLLDEVMAGLNAAETERIVELVRAINRSGVTILLIEHVMRAVMSLSARVIVINYGETIAAGPPDEVASDPRVIEAYLGEPGEADRGAAPA
jgi:branched-chain amino acid transport system ATP-binding protein